MPENTKPAAVTSSDGLNASIDCTTSSIIPAALPPRKAATFRIEDFRPLERGKALEGFFDVILPSGLVIRDANLATGGGL